MRPIKIFARICISWLPLGIAITLICGLIYGAVQQNYRQSLNDPQIQMAQDGATRLAAGDVPASLVQRGVPLIDAASSLAPWIAVYDSNGTPLESSAVLDGKPPAPPQGIFDLAKAQGNNLPHNTWQPENGVRIALVVVPVQGKDWFVAAGRNMREVEGREQGLELVIGLGWVVTIVATFLAQALVQYLV